MRLKRVTGDDLARQAPGAEFVLQLDPNCTYSLSFRGKELLVQHGDRHPSQGQII